ncbi:MAG: sulfotransferase [Gemmatimonadetes bacterium]|nr:sulfotransferase [Gemmatimonadota bacterium]
MENTVTYDPGQTKPLLRFQNRIGSLIQRLNPPWTNLDDESLIEAARRSVKWDDFASDHFREPLRVLADGARNCEHVSYTGKLLIRKGTVNAVSTRLRVQRALADHPEIREQPVKRPIIIVGAPRTGTTLLNNLLSLDPVSRPLLGWEALRPAPITRRQKRGTTPRGLLMRLRFNEWVGKRAMPELMQMHPFAYDRPDECHWLLWPSFVFLPAIVMPAFRNWLMAQPESVYEPAYADYRLALQLLEWQRPAEGHWVLKSPVHLWALDAIMNAVPEASFVQTHRNLTKVLPSFCSLAATLLVPLVEKLEPRGMGPVAMEITADVIARFTRAREIVNPKRIMDICYPDLVANPIAAVRTIYDRFGYEYTPEFEIRMTSYLRDSTQSKRPRHEYPFEGYGLDEDAISEAFASYHQAYGVEQKI